MIPRRYARLSAILDRRQPTLTVLIDDLQKAHNVSAVLRTCDAVGVLEAHGITDSESFRAKVTSAAGSDRYVEMRLHPDFGGAFRHLRERGLQVVAAALDETAVDFREVDYTLPTCVVLGQEGPGLATDILAQVDTKIMIPMSGAVESLNVSVAAAVILFEAQRQRQAAGLYDTPQVDEVTRQRLLFEWGHRKLAEYCRQKGYPYPRIGDDGELLDPIPRG
ncbi:MAG: tRNA (guanosine(18)-2'-O)-methyltransferase TrmH [Thermoanaerobaculia bacterium]|nr:tRNA (guanosine(18)-2'-O)-methyltransferase TrmH [Thermoanaerobaculia bacterium]